jgi:capsular exopolysaccharide synthesis family protein
MLQEGPASQRPTSQDPGFSGGQERTSAAGGDQWHFVDYLRLLSKRRWTAIPVFVLIVAGVVVMTYAATPLYEARSQILIEAETQNIVTFQEVVEQERATVEYYTTQYMILQSRALARTTIDKLNLWNHRELVGRPEEEGSTELPIVSGVMASALRMTEGLVTRALGPQRADAIYDATKNSASAGADETRAQTLAIEAFLGHLTITPVRNSRLVDVKFRSTDPQLAAAVANALSQAYVDRTLEFKLSASKEAADWLANQLSDQKQKVEQSERALQKYREQNTTLSTEDAQVVQKLSDLNAMLTRAKTDRLHKELLYQQVLANQGDRAALQTYPAIASSPSVQRLKAQLSDLLRDEAQLSRDFGDKWPALDAARTAIKATDAKLDAEIENGVKLIHNEVQAAKAQEESLTRTLEAQKGDALMGNREAIGYQALQREAASNRQIFDTLMQRAKETNISSQLRTNNIRVADEANPPTAPAWPDKKRNLLFALMGGLAMGIALAFVAEYLDNKLKSPEEIRDDLGLRCLGLVPKVVAKTSETLLMNNDVPAVFTEAFRAVRTNVLFSLETGGSGGDIGRSLLVTSTAPAEGKTLVTSNLAAAIAMSGQRVMLIDADMRRPRLHDIFQRPQEPGLSNLVMGKVKASEAIRETDISGLWLLPAGLMPSNPTELLSSRRFRDVLDALLRQFDWVIIDSPPTMAVIDASVIAHTVAGVLFVVAAEKTSRPAAIKALEQLEVAKANFVGVVLNRVDVKRNAFYYSPYYRQDYSEYYSRSA